ncbi:hypothetical protein [Campylobacter sp.]|uniref:hypothetical protein n=1 Tax=Campylobacter sp. TaxID=205 RepID=UPI002AA7EB93|nr:hypothetical protein [Campylobacter sp.]MCI6564615.1 hypothetical protein [Campylobacter sp.]MCI6579707.1 hypothetical protein [Campylobacter sp.]MCI7014202.1 hypothetical protein [Campylobacter sp.]
MYDDFLKQAGNVAKVQKHELNASENKLAEVNNKLKEIQKVQNINKDILDKSTASLDDAIAQMEKLLGQHKASSSNANIYLNKIISDLENLDIDKSKFSQIETVKNLENISFDSDWDSYILSVNNYAKNNNINLAQDPFRDLMTPSQIAELNKRIKEDFTFKNAKCDKYDYLIGATCGIIGGLIDILFVGEPGNSLLGNFTDKMANEATEKFASFCGWDKSKALERDSDTTKSAIGFLENKFKINYDHATTKSTGGAIENLSMSNHHLKSLGHSPDIIGLFFSILNQFTSTSTFVSNGAIITIDTKTFELQGSNVISKIFSGFVNWFGHLASDWTGSSGATGRGSGIPIPFYNLFQLCSFGEFGQHKQTFAQVTSQVFEQGYDFRHGLTMSIPVLLTEILIRLMYTIKSRYYHKKDWEECMPNANIPELRRMLLVGHGSLCLIDSVDAYIRSGCGANAIALLSRLNLIGWVRFAHLSLKEIKAFMREGKIDSDAIDAHLDQEFKSLLANYKH